MAFGKLLTQRFNQVDQQDFGKAQKNFSDGGVCHLGEVSQGLSLVPTAAAGIAQGLGGMGRGT
jgi:hypothetical protein